MLKTHANCGDQAVGQGSSFPRTFPATFGRRRRVSRQVRPEEHPPLFVFEDVRQQARQEASTVQN
jgi:hypothetical protein